MPMRPFIAALAAAVVGAAASFATLVPSAGAQGGSARGYTTTVIATGTAIGTAIGTTVNNPDDMALFGNNLFVSFQDDSGSSGGGNSTIAELSPTGTLLNHWTVSGRCEGLVGDPANNRLIGTVNEDGNSSLFTIDPTTSKPTLYSYSPSTLPHGGGTDAVSIYNGQILISASNPDTTSSSYPNVPAVYVATLSGTTATLTQLYSDGASATVANVGPHRRTTVTLGLTDPDSNEVVPASAGRFGGAFLVNSQGDQQQVYMGGNDNSAPSGLFVLNLSQSIDDTAWATDPDGTLYFADSSDNEIIAVTGHFNPGTAFVSATPGNANNAPPNPGPNYLATLDTNNGTVTAVPGVNQPPKGMLFVP